MDRLTRAFEIALEQADQMHRNGRDEQALAAVLAVAREILHAAQVEMSVREPRHDDMDFASIVAAMRESLNARFTRDLGARANVTGFR